MNALTYIIEEYAVFEAQVRDQMSKLCGPYCSACQSVCCRAEYCRENIDSPFLSLLRRRVLPPAEYDPNRGWLSKNGCTLAVARPPVCYQFCCRKIMNAQPDGYHRYVLQILSNLIAHIGKNALCGRHLVEIMEAAKLQHIRLTGFQKRLDEARNAFRIIQSFYAQGSLEPAFLPALAKIFPLRASIAVQRDLEANSPPMVHTRIRPLFAPPAPIGRRSPKI